MPAGQIDGLSGATFGASFDSGDAGVAGALCFDVNNNSGSDIEIDLAVVTVNQGGIFWGFTGGVELDGTHVSHTWAEGVGSTEFFTFIIAQGSSAVFDFEYGAVYGTLDAWGDIDFTLIGSAIPLPMSSLLLLGGLGGFAALKRRKKT